MRKIDLSGEWMLYKAGSKKKIPAQVPGCVHADLMTAAELPDIGCGLNPEVARVVSDNEWIFEKVFNFEEVAKYASVMLSFDGLHGCAVVRLNDTDCGRSSNLFEGCEYEVKSLLKPLKNKLVVMFLPSEPKKNTAFPGSRRQPGVEQPESERPGLPTVGIWRDVSLLAFEQVRVTDVRIHQDFSTAGLVKLDVAVQSERFDPDRHLEILAKVYYKGSVLYEARDILNRDALTLSLRIKNPQLWWPVGLGEQPLYEVTVGVLAGRTGYAYVSRRIGLRQFSLEKTPGSPGRLLINGKPMYLKGASWVPADLLVSRLTRVEYACLVKAAAMANMNCLRVWGGGFYENDAFYNLCDEYGICVWQDFMLHRDVALTPDKVDLASFEREVQTQIRRLRHHACLALWCGGESGEKEIPLDYLQIAESLVHKLDSDTPYMQPLPHRPFSLMHQEGFRSLPSYPEPRVMAGYLDEEERNIGHPACVCHTVPPDGARRIYQGFFDNFLLPTTFNHTLWLSQIQQAVVLQQVYEQARMADRSPAGFLYWHFNESWSCGSPSALDADGRWKALHYFAQRFFASISLCGQFRDDLEMVDLHVFHDGQRPVFKGEIQWRISQMDGVVALEGSKKVTVAPASHELPVSIKVGDCLKKSGPDNLLMWIYLLDEQGNQVAWNTVFFCAPRQLQLPPPRMKAEIRVWDDNSFAVILTSHYPVLWVWLSLEGLEARFDENFFCLEPDKPFSIRITPVTRIKLDQFRQLIRIGSLRDTWQEKRSLMQIMSAARKK